MRMAKIASSTVNLAVCCPRPSDDASKEHLGANAKKIQCSMALKICNADCVFEAHMQRMHPNVGARITAAPGRLHMANAEGYDPEVGIILPCSRGLASFGPVRR